nr:hypothetical protein [uncultured Sphaerochaeta sp.]
MKKKFVLTLALVLMVAGTLVAATPIEVSGTFESGYDFEFTAPTFAQTSSGNEAEVKTLTSISTDMWKVSLATVGVMYDGDAAVAATADIYLDKALAEEGVDLGDISLTLSLGNGVSGDASSVYADLNDYVDDDGTAVGMSTTGDNFGVKIGYADLVTVYASADPTLKAFPMVLGATITPVDGVEAAVGFTNDYSGNNAMTVSAKADVAALAGLDFDFVATGALMTDLGASTSAIAADAELSIEGIGAWVAYYNDMANANFLTAKASYSTSVEGIDLSASFKADMADLAVSGDEEFTIAAGAGYSMGGVDYALDAAYAIKAATFTLSPSVSISF